MNMFGLQSKLNQVQYNPVGGVTPSGWEGPNRGNQTSPSTGFFGTSNTTTPFARRTPSYAPLPGGAYDPATQQEWNPSESRVEEIVRMLDSTMPQGVITIKDVDYIRYTRSVVTEEDIRLADNA
jgi:hypothetical protein